MPLILLMISGCLGAHPPSSSPPFRLPSATELLNGYRPPTVSLTEININVTVPEDFSEAYKSQEYQSHFFKIGVNSSTGVPRSAFVAQGIRYLWLVQPNDTVIYGSYELHSNKHSIREEYVSISGSHRSGSIILGGLEFRVIPEGDHMALAFFGPHTKGSNGFSLSFTDRPILRISRFNHTSIFPMSDTFDISFEQRNVTATIYLRYWGSTSFEFDSRTMTSMRSHPENIDDQISQYASDFLPGGRFGQTSAFCGGEILRTPAPCMMQWEHPQV
jgi:hypothetical protein